MKNSIILEAKGIAGNIYSGNAIGANFYAFSQNGKKICYVSIFSQGKNI